MKNFIVVLLKFLFGLEKIKQVNTTGIKNVLIIRQHNQFGDLLASSSLFTALKESIKECKISVLVAPQNFYAITKNSFIDSYFVFEKRKIFNVFYISRLIKYIRNNYDLCIVPSTVSLSLTSSLFARFSNAKIKLGVSELDGKTNRYSFLFNYTVKLDWRLNPDRHVADFGLDIVRPLGIKTNNFNSIISFDADDEIIAQKFIDTLQAADGDLIIGIHAGAGKPKNRWSLNKFIKLVEELNNKYKIKIFFTGSKADSEEIEYLKNNLKIKAVFYLDKTIPQLAALISKSDLFITNDTGVMHVAGSTNTPQISIFGPTNPFNWAPIGKNKYFLRAKSELIDDITVDNVLNLCEKILNSKNE
jgi:ADP-heptose:LPS heptosyltransferase